MTLADSFAAFEDEFLGPDPDDVAAPIPDLAEADRELRRIARIRRRISSDCEVAEAETARVSDWLTKRLELHEAAEAFHRERLERYHRAVLALDPKAKTITLPAGQLKARAQQPEWRFLDGVFMAWAIQHAPEVVRPPKPGEPSLDANAAKKLLTQTDAKGRAVAFGVTAAGEKPPGVEVEVRGDKFDITFEEEQ